MRYLTRRGQAELLGIAPDSMTRLVHRHRDTLPEATTCPVCGHEGVRDADALTRWKAARSEALTRRTRIIL